MICYLPFLLLLCSLVWPACVHAQTPDAEFKRAETAWDKRDYAAAEAHFGRALEFAKADEDATAHALYGRGVARFEQRKWQGALDDLNDSIALNPDNAEAFASRGMARKSLGDYTGLLADAHRAAQIDPEYAGFEDDAKSTVNWRRSMLGFIVLGCILAAVGLVPMLRSLNRAIQGEREGKARAS